MHMRTTLNIDDRLLKEASRVTGVREKTSLVKKGLSWTNAHLLAACLLGGASLWTGDKPLMEAARSCGAALYRA